MSSYRHRFVGLTELPQGLSEFHAEHAFGLSQEDVENVRKFPAKARLAAGAQLVLARATGRSFAHTKPLPPALLQYLSRTLGVSDISIASLRALYSRQRTLFDHRKWAFEQAGFRESEEADLLDMLASLQAQAGNAISVDDLVRAGELWLFDQKIQLPSDRAIRDVAREAFSAAEISALDVVRQHLPPARLDHVLKERVLRYQHQFPVTQLWGRGDKASSDMMSLDATQHLYNARIDPRRRTHAVEIYTHVLGSYGIFHDEAIVLNVRQHSIAVHGAEHYNATRESDEIRLSLLAVDTHGYTNAAMAVAKGLGFDLCPRLKNLAEQKLFVPRGFHVPPALELAAVGTVSMKAIISGWDDFLRMLASVKTGRVTPKFLLEKLGSAAQGDGLHKTLDSLGRLLRTAYKPFNCPAMAPQSSNSCSFMLGLDSTSGRAPIKKKLSIAIITSWQHCSSDRKSVHRECYQLCNGLCSCGVAGLFRDDYVAIFLHDYIYYSYAIASDSTESENYLESQHLDDPFYKDHGKPFWQH